MKRKLLPFVVAAAAAVAMCVAGRLWAQEDTPERALKVARPTLGIAGPFTHKNLSLYILYLQDKSADGREFLTLDEGLASGDVVVMELDSAEVAQLAITNKSDTPLFLQAGELLRGGKQDRTLQTSLVIPPHTKRAMLPSFCVERSRWEGAKDFQSQGVYAPREVREAAAGGSQRDVWSKVEDYKSRANEGLAAAAGEKPDEMKSSSINEQLGGKRYHRVIDDYIKKLSDSLDDVKNPVGMAYIVSGQISTVDIYSNSGLFRKLFPKLLRSAASEAVARSQDKSAVPGEKAIVRFIDAAFDGTVRQRDLSMDNVLIRISGDSSLVSQLFYQRDVVHTQVIQRGIETPKPKPLPRPVPQRPVIEDD